jgi:hypothetical protein
MTNDFYLCPLNVIYETCISIPVCCFYFHSDICPGPCPGLAKGVTYGAGTTAQGAIPVNDLDTKTTSEKFTGKISGKVVEVCQEKGCWMKIEKADGEKLMVKFKDYAYFMPKNIEGKEVVLEGETIVKEVSRKTASALCERCW